jgi:hypothetical protein
MICEYTKEEEEKKHGKSKTSGLWHSAGRKG